jgi:VWFA-related protein
MPMNRVFSNFLAASILAVPAADKDAPPKFTTSSRSVRVPVSVLDSRGEPVLDLRGEDFEISEDGRRQPITFFSGERRPVRIALALDTSLSMTNKMSQVEEALRHFIELLEPADEILVITFSSSVVINDDFTSDREQLERVFSRLNPGEGTALYDAAIEAIHRVSAGPAESKAVVLVTDGIDQSSHATLAELRELARRSEVPIFSIGIGGDPGLRLFRPGSSRPRGPGRGPTWPGGGGRRGWPPGGGPVGWPGGVDGTGQGTPRDPRDPGSWIVRGDGDVDPRPLNELAEDTGGRAVILKNVERAPGKNDRLKEAVESIALTLRHRYLVGYLEPERGKRGWREIHVHVDRPSVKVQARKGYYAGG